ncbi:hypothetical protein [Demequina oxidasica]|uniref:hypothetical protein n=1 Tax=Demequina oxidasica TaxID=676199 RepID=UPI000783D21E|nr:hypothetical protein [Demequina oxidasica]
MLSPHRDEIRELTDAAIVAIMGSLRAPRTEGAREAAIREAISRAYADKHRADAKASPAPGVTTGARATAPADAVYAPPVHSSAFTPPEQSNDHVDDKDRRLTESTQASTASPRSTDADERAGVGDRGIGVGSTSSPLGPVLAYLSPWERVAAISWWIDGCSADDVADRLGTTPNSAVDMLHRAGVALAGATGDTPPNRDHFVGGGDVITVEVSGGSGR